VTRSAVNYYRAALRRLFKGRVPKPQVIDRPVLMLWGDRDRFLGRKLADPPIRFVPNHRVEHFPDASHWVQLDAKDEVNAHLLAFFRE
jgi:pimeloyl-ACP methyl ester carboxylesterase